MDIRKSMEKKRISSAVEALTKGSGTKGLKFPTDITYNSLSYLDLIRSYKNITTSELAKLLGVSKSAVTMKVAELEKKGYVIKKISAKDKRIKHLEISCSLADIYDKFEVLDEDIYGELEGMYTKQELDSFCKILDYISDRIIEQTK